MTQRTVTMTFTLTFNEDGSIPSFGCMVSGLPETDDTSTEELVTDMLSDTFSAAVKAHNELVFNINLSR